MRLWNFIKRSEHIVSNHCEPLRAVTRTESVQEDISISSYEFVSYGDF